MATNTSSSNKNLTSKRIIMVMMTLSRQFMRFELAKQFLVSRVAKSTYSSKAVIFIPQIESSKAYSNYLAHSLSEYARGPQERKLLTIDY
jgi:hypothetical protein